MVLQVRLDQVVPKDREGNLVLLVPVVQLVHQDPLDQEERMVNLDHKVQEVKVDPRD